MYNMIFSFILISVLILLLIIKVKGYFVLKTVLIPMILWYGMSLYFSVQNLQGWPTSEEPPDKSIIVSYIVEEPTNIDKGRIYLFCVSREYVKQKILIDPTKSFDYDNKEEPRLYKIPYKKMDRDELKKKNAGNRITMYMRKKAKGLKKGKGTNDTDSNIRQVPGTEILKKED